MSIQAEINRLQKYKYRLKIEYAQPGNPCEEEDGNWQLYSFDRRLPRFKERDEFFDEYDSPKGDLGQKLKRGLAFMLMYSEHGPQCQWDAVAHHDEKPSFYDGVLIWEEPASHMGAKSREARLKDAKAFTEQYTDWSNGDSYYVRVEDRKGKFITGDGVIGSRYLLEVIRDVLPDDATENNTELCGEVAMVVHAKDIFGQTPA